MKKDNYKIYMHKNKINEKVYIGQTKRTLEQRSGSDGRGYKECDRFWNAIQKYGWDNFEHIILEENIPNREMANGREIYYIELYNSTNIDFGYNISSGGTLNEYQYKPVYQYTLGGIFIKKYNSITQAALEVGCHPANIIACCNGKRNHSYGYQWRREFYKSIPPVTLRFVDHHDIPVFSYDMQGNFIEGFEDAYEAKKMLENVHDISKIVACCDGKLPTVYGRQWRWYKCDNIGVASSINYIHKKKHIYRYDKITKEFLGEYESASVASEEIFGHKNDSGRRNINSCINGKRASAYGSVWSYLPPEEFLLTN